MEPLYLSLITSIIGLFIGIIFYHYLNKKTKKINVLGKGQFSLYKKLWNSLIKLQIRAEDLFHEPEKNILLKFSEALRELKDITEQSKAIMNKADFEELMKTISSFESYSFDDKTLSDIKEEDKVSSDTIEDAIDIKDKENYEKVADKIIESSNDIAKSNVDFKVDPWN